MLCVLCHRDKAQSTLTAAALLTQPILAPSAPHNGLVWCYVECVPSWTTGIPSELHPTQRQLSAELLFSRCTHSTTLSRLTCAQ